MKNQFATGLCVAGALALATAAFAQTTGQTQQPPTPAPAAQTAQADQVTLTGCVQKEADYRATQNKGQGGVVGTGVGVENEYVLVGATVGAAKAADAVGTSGTPTTPPAAPMAYEVTGPNEGQLAQFVGRRVEITGKLKAAEMGAAGATGGVTAGTPPTGVDVASKDLKLREVEVLSVKEATGTCGPDAK